ncbi:transketolase [Asticcacaulis excentricus CB 48]|uniref:Transketolase n=1 Tax=Asticcacaulis excentricus (strain ATCC 15261 / DSM 4724 / KCTC 12464 / NCIMB 9791 / VKM B-1370 / CB 48) TaxID=573065 RepID=E8RPT7_ASTEC|nr:transketolase [Asticcacaulis excentricus CB 48]
MIILWLDLSPSINEDQRYPTGCCVRGPHKNKGPWQGSEKPEGVSELTDMCVCLRLTIKAGSALSFGAVFL